ncbi:MAG: phosphodiesterase [Granulosicoccus sp.]|nr:phosphodiesterase [Granulosicoccus sp.]
MSRILQITDMHVVSPPGLVSGRLDTARILENAIDRILEDWHKFAPIDVLIATGDITDRGDNESYRLFRKQIERLPAPTLLIPGNHDRREPLRACFSDAPHMPVSGKINWVHDLPDLRIIGLDTLIEGQGGGELDADTLEFLALALDQAGETPVLIALHHPPFQSGIRFMDAIGLESTQGLSDVLQNRTNDIRLVCGHVHGFIVGSIGLRVAISSAAVCSSFPADYRADAPVGYTTHPGGYAIHSWDNGFRSASVTLADGAGPYPFKVPETA